MDAKTFLDHFATISEVSDGVDQLRKLVLDLAISGRLVEQRLAERSVELALADVRCGKSAVLEVKVRGRSAVPREPEAWEVSTATPRGWCWARIDDTGAYVNGLAFNQSDWHSDGLPIIRIQNLTDPTAEFNYARGSFPSDRTVDDGDILVSWSATLEAFVWDRGRAVVNQHIFKAIPDLRVVRPGFLYHLLRHTIRQLAASDAAHGLAMKHINRGPFVSHVVGLPPLEEQDRIVTKIGELMLLCDELESRQRTRQQLSSVARASCFDALTVANTDELNRVAWSRIRDNWEHLITRPEEVADAKKAILQLAISGRLSGAVGIDFEAGQDRPSQLAAPRVEADLADRIAVPFELPEGWEWHRLQELVPTDRTISYGVIKLGPDPGPGRGTPILRCSDVKSRRIERAGIRHIESSLSAEYSRTILRGGELLVNIRGTLGGCAVVPSNMAGYNIAREVAVIPVKEDVNPEYLLTVFAAPLFQSAVTAALRGTAYKGLNLGLLREFPIPVPPRAEQDRIEAMVRALMIQCDALETALARRGDAGRRLAATIALV